MNKNYINELKREYNKYLMRHFKACAYMDDNKVAIEDRDNWIPEYRKILDNLNRILNQLEIYEVTYSADEALGGFTIEEVLKKGA